MSPWESAWRDEVESAVEFLSLIDADNRLIYVNHPQPGLGDYVGRPVFEFVSPEYHELARRSIEATRATGYPQHYDSEAVGPHGETSFYSNWIFQLSNDEDAGVVAFVATDITSLRRVEDELTRTDVTLRSLVDHAPDHIMIVDRERRLTFVNRLELGYELDDVMGRPVENFVAPPDRARVAAEIDAVIRTGERRSYETVVNAPTGDYVFLTRAGPITVDHTVEGVVMISTDITRRLEAEQERERLNAQLQRAQKMEALGQLTGGVAHDFNNLLTAIGANLELLHERIVPGSDSADYLAGAVRAVDQAADLTRRLLVFARHQPLVATSERIDQLIDDMAPLLSRTLGEGVEVRADAADDLWLCRVDRGQLEQAVLNLAVNARDAMPTGGTLVIATENAVLEEPPDAQLPSGEYVSLTVRDTGFGMDAEIAEQAFEPFFTTKDPGRGTGLGLSMVYGFVSQSGGHVSLTSRPGSGTTVRILLPRVETADPPPVGDESPEVLEGLGEIVLVVEDQAMVREACVHMLESLGYRTREAEDASEAIALLAEHDDTSLVLSDLGLPGEIDGLELARRARKLEPPLRVVLMSGYADRAVTGEDLFEGIRFLPKPFKLTDLADAIADSLSD